MKFYNIISNIKIVVNIANVLEMLNIWYDKENLIIEDFPVCSGTVSPAAVEGNQIILQLFGIF